MKIFAIQLQPLDDKNARNQIEQLKPFVSLENAPPLSAFVF